MQYRHIVDRKVDIDIRVLCDFMDKLCALLVVANCLQKTSSVHNIMLPRSWICDLVGNMDALKEQELRLMWLYLTPSTILLERICSGREAGKSRIDVKQKSLVSSAHSVSHHQSIFHMVTAQSLSQVRELPISYLRACETLFSINCDIMLTPTITYSCRNLCLCASQTVPQFSIF